MLAAPAGALLVTLASSGLVTVAEPRDVLAGRIGSIGIADVATPHHMLAGAAILIGVFLCLSGLSVPSPSSARRSEL
jgi:hypothetical protein